MTNVLGINKVAVAVLIIAAIAVAFGAEMAVRTLQKGIADSRAVRVAEVDSCSASQDTHFVGCSSIL